MTRATVPRCGLLWISLVRNLASPTHAGLTEVAVNCPSPKCGSSNVQLLSHYRDSHPPDSPLRDVYAQPAAADVSYLAAAGLALLGIVVVVSGAVFAGLVAVAVGAGWGVVIHRRAEAAELARARWANRRICLACTEQWTP
ncbi:hypothetical protein ACJ6WF_05465 [Streptomyces sp. MMS24-I2-30]|uniref:hypothetical protein n=1 Tax=Streptomyces sp. MMS24-I2-30 TaxID=3351564 RepID=UPI003896C44D